MLIKNNFVFPKVKMRLVGVQIVETNFTQYNLKFKLSNDWFKTSIKSKINKDQLIRDISLEGDSNAYLICNSNNKCLHNTPTAYFGESQYKDLQY